MTSTTKILASALAVALGIAGASPAFAQAAGGGRGGGGSGSGEGAVASTAGAVPERIRDTGCYRPGDRITIDWNGLASFDGEIRLVMDGTPTRLPVTSWTDRAVMVKLSPGGTVPGNRTYPVVWTSKDEVLAKIGELSTCAIE